jgi:hypothetical protein
MNRWLVSATGLALAALGVGSDRVLPGAPGLGMLQWMLIVAGAAIVPLGPLSGIRRLGYAACLAVVSGCYLVALAFEIPLDVRAGSPRNGVASLRGLVQPARWGGYELVPGWRGIYDDGWAKSAVDINSRGDRDDEPHQQPPGQRARVLLIGDSQTFGVGLPREDDIESQIERQSDGAVAAYNLGVPGYGPGDSLEHYRENGDVDATHAFFLLYDNDLRFDNCHTATHTAYAGFIVSREGADALALEPDALEQEIAASEQTGEQSPWQRIKRALQLEQLRRRAASLLDPEPMLLPPGSSSDSSRSSCSPGRGRRHCSAIRCRCRRASTS